jgi:hypothetical protein
LPDILGDRVRRNPLINPAPHLSGSIFGDDITNVATGNVFIVGDSVPHVAGVAVIEFGVRAIGSHLMKVFG